MSSAIALLICTIFVLFMLRLDRKQSTEVTFAFWIPTIWFLIVSSKPVAIWFQSTGATIEEGNPLDRLFLIIMLCLGVTILIKRKFNWSAILKENISLVLLLSYMLVSCLWADTPFISFKRWTRELIAIIMASVIISEPQPWKALESLLRRTTYILIPLSFILINYFPEYGRIYVHHSGDLMWVGASIHKNSLTQLCLAAIFFLVWTFIRRRRGSSSAVPRYQTILEIFILFLAVWIMGGPNHNFNYSATATIAGVIGFMMLMGFYWFKKYGRIPSTSALAALILIVIIYGTLTPMIGKLSLINVSSVAGRDETLTGRAQVWEQVVPTAMKRPLFGHGHEGFWTTDSRKDFDISGAHNGFLDIILSLGFVGLGLYSVFFLSNIRKAQEWMVKNFDWGVFWICSLLMLLLSNITESYHSFISQAFVIILCLTFASTASENRLGSI